MGVRCLMEERGCTMFGGRAEIGVRCLMEEWVYGVWWKRVGVRCLMEEIVCTMFDGRDWVFDV